MGTSHRQAPVKDVVGRVRDGLAELFSLPDGYEIVARQRRVHRVLGRRRRRPDPRRSLHLAFGEFSQKFATAAAGAPFLDDPIVVSADPGTAPTPTRRPGRRRHRLGAQRDVDRRDGRRRSARPTPATRWSSSTRRPAPAACRST